MKTFLKNYTSNVPVVQTLAEIEKVLIKCGVTGIQKDYHPSGSGKVIAVTFQIKFTDGQPAISIRLPANEERALQALWMDYVDGESVEKVNGGDERILYNNRKQKRRNDFRDQAERTAWRIVRDWIEVQMSMIQMQQADFLQVFLPYVWDGKLSYYDRLNQSKFAGLLPQGGNQ